MTAAIYNLEIEQGVSFKESFVLRDSDNQLMDLTGYTARMQIRPYVSSELVLIDATSENAMIVISPTLGKVEIQLTPAQTELLTFTKSVYDMELVSPSSEVIRLVQGVVLVSPQVTRE